VGPIEDKIGSPVEPHPRLNQAHAAQGGITLGLEQGGYEADFSHLGKWLGRCGLGTWRT
jgi:hypothetical protein